LIASYELYLNIDDTEVHPSFVESGTIEDGTVRFDLLSNEVGYYDFYLKVTAEGDEEYWSS